MAEKPAPFRVHFDDGSHWDTSALDAHEARKFAKTVSDQRRTVIRKIKLIRENERG
ncbi:hypothetical protein [Rhizobium skierniewicense]|uniref:hypothetical protein n=1 Tax=Rhizobium skierniewicense TaxID=984260 RepID=UPI001573276B|nr:hypothetical protein [Rhizobium skierniewicense]NTF32336.1 hypothetical protein [Rhizobium skierniewicense]